MVQLEDLRHRLVYDGWIKKERRKSRQNFKERYLRVVDGQLNFYDERHTKLPRKVRSRARVAHVGCAPAAVRTQFGPPGLSRQGPGFIVHAVEGFSQTYNIRSHDIRPPRWFFKGPSWTRHSLVSFVGVLLGLFNLVSLDSVSTA